VGDDGAAQPRAGTLFYSFCLEEPSSSIAASQQQGGKKESAGHRRSRLCQPCATPSSNSSLNYRRSDARIAENGFATSRGVSKSAKSSARAYKLIRFIRISHRTATDGLASLK
jgi:hypothetical protein